MDGCSRLSALVRIILPMSLPGAGRGGLLLLHPGLERVPLRQRVRQQRRRPDDHHRAHLVHRRGRVLLGAHDGRVVPRHHPAGGCSTSIFQRWVVKGLTLGAVKGYRDVAVTHSRKDAITERCTGIAKTGSSSRRPWPPSAPRRPVVAGQRESRPAGEEDHLLAPARTSPPWPTNSRSSRCTSSPSRPGSRRARSSTRSVANEQMQAKLAAAIEAGNPPDVTRLYESNVQFYAAGGHLLDVNDIVDKMRLGAQGHLRFGPDLGRVQGTRHGRPPGREPLARPRATRPSRGGQGRVPEDLGRVHRDVRRRSSLRPGSSRSAFVSASSRTPPTT